MAGEGGKDRHQNGNPEKRGPKLSPGLGMEGGGAAAGAVVLDQDGETSSTEGYREEGDPCRKGSHPLKHFKQVHSLNFMLRHFSTYLKER